MQRFVQWSDAREPPAYVVAGLRAVDPRADALWWGPHTDYVETAPDPATPWRKRIVPVTYPVWLIGITDGLRVMNAAASRRLRQLDGMKVPAVLQDQPADLSRWMQSWRARWRAGQLAYQGFVGTFFWPATDLDWSVVREFESMGWFARHLFDIVRRAEMARLAKEEAEGAESAHLIDRQKLIAEAIRATMPSIWRHVFRGRRSIPVAA